MFKFTAVVIALAAVVLAPAAAFQVCFAQYADDPNCDGPSQHGCVENDSCFAYPYHGQEWSGQVSCDSNSADSNYKYSVFFTDSKCTGQSTVISGKSGACMKGDQSFAVYCDGHSNYE